MVTKSPTKKVVSLDEKLFKDMLDLKSMFDVYSTRKEIIVYTRWQAHYLNRDILLASPYNPYIPPLFANYKCQKGHESEPGGGYHKQWVEACSHAVGYVYPKRLLYEKSQHVILRQFMDEKEKESYWTENNLLTVHGKTHEQLCEKSYLVLKTKEILNIPFEYVIAVTRMFEGKHKAISLYGATKKPHE